MSWCASSLFSVVIYKTMSTEQHFDNNRKTRTHDDVIKWKHFPRYWPFMRGIHRFPVNSPHKGQWRGALMFSLICVWINGWVNNREAGDLRRYCTHYDVTIMLHFENKNISHISPSWESYEVYFVNINKVESVEITLMLHKVHGISNHMHIDCLFDSLLMLRTKTTEMFIITGIWWGESTDDRWIPLTNGQWQSKRFRVVAWINPHLHIPVHCSPYITSSSITSYYL